MYVLVCQWLSVYLNYFSYVLFSNEKSPPTHKVGVVICRKQSSQRHRIKPKWGVAGEGEGAETTQE